MVDVGQLAAVEAEVERLRMERALMLKKQRLMWDHWYFLTEGLGYDPKEIKDLTDPGLQRLHMQAQDYVNLWLSTRDKQHNFRKLLIMAPRETWKSTAFTIPTISRVHLHLPNGAFFISSAKMEKMAEKFGRAVMQQWQAPPHESPLVQLFGPFRDSAERRKWTSSECVTLLRHGSALRNRADPTLKVFSVETGGTSGHCEFGVLDDPFTEEMVKKYRHSWFDMAITHLKSLGYVVRKDGMLAIIMTRYGERDLAGHIKREEIEPVVRERVLMGAPRGELPADFEERWWEYGPLAGWWIINMAGEEKDENAEGGIRYPFPVLWPKERIEAKRAEDPMFVATQVNNRPGERPDHQVQKENIQWIPRSEVPEVAYTQGRLFLHGDTAWKKAGQRNARGDWNVLMAVLHYEGQVYLVRGWHSRKASKEKYGEAWIDMLRWARFRKTKFRRYTYDKPIGSADAGHQRWYWSLANDEGLRAPPILEINRAAQSGAKHDRILDTAGYWQDGRVWLVEGVEGARELETEMLTLSPAILFDDHADCFSDTFHDSLYKPAARDRQVGPDAVDEKDDAMKYRPAIAGDIRGGRFVPRAAGVEPGFNTWLPKGGKRWL